MAFLDITGNESLPTIYNVSMGVGPDPRGFYRRDDILLVQYLLKKVWEEHGSEISPPLPAPPEPGTIKVDGIFGPITARWIKRYQEEVKKSGQPIAADGRVDRAHGTVSSITHTLYTILLLNFDFHNKEQSSFDDLTTDPECPPELIAALSTTIN
jgi:peptidoglycan hydrolase-like protein with peptidoglycan-binding domain